MSADVAGSHESTSISHAARPRLGLGIAILMLGLFWGFMLLVPWLELSMSMRFISRWIDYGLLLVGFLAWWLSNRSVNRRDRWLALTVVTVAGTVGALAADSSVNPFAFVMIGFPWVFTVWTAWLLIARGAPPDLARIGFCIVVALTWGYFDLLGLDGLDGAQRSQERWRWNPTAEQRFLAERAKPVVNLFLADPAQTTTLSLQPGDWPEFRGPNRDSRVSGTNVRPDWQASPPKLLWRKRVGPGWGSVAIVDGRLFTQEQHDEAEATICYDARTGDEIWVHADPGRFVEQLSGPGPRATPTFAGGQLFTFGALGRLNCLDAASGKLLWTRDGAREADAAVPQWGFSGSPLVTGDLVVAFVGGTHGGGVAYDVRSGEPRWTVATGANGYSSPQRVNIDGHDFVLFESDQRLLAIAPGTGLIAWEHPLAGAGSTLPIAQPQRVGPNEILVPAGVGVALLKVAHEGDRPEVHEQWTTTALKPSLNDFVVHDGTIFGFDDGIFSATDLATGKRRWKRGRYGHGQVLLLADQGLLIVAGETGEVVLLAANAERHEERGRFQAIQGKTWNHPVLAQGNLYVRNGEEMACYDCLQTDQP